MQTVHHPRSGPPMPYLVRDRLFFGNIEDAAAVLTAAGAQFMDILSVLRSSSIFFFSDWRTDLFIPTKPVHTVLGDNDGSAPVGRPCPGGRCSMLARLAGEGLGIVRMAVGLRDTDDEDLIDYLDVCLDFIVVERRDGCVLVHCFTGISRRIWTCPYSHSAFQHAIRIYHFEKAVEGGKEFTDGDIVEKVLCKRYGYVIGLGRAEVPPSRKDRLMYNMDEDSQLRTRTEEQEQELNELRTWKTSQEERSNAQ